MFSIGIDVWFMLRLLRAIRHAVADFTCHLCKYSV